MVHYNKKQREIRDKRTIICECCKQLVKEPMANQKYCKPCKFYVLELRAERDRHLMNLNKLKKIIQGLGYTLSGKKL